MSEGAVARDGAFFDRLGGRVGVSAQVAQALTVWAAHRSSETA